MKLVIVLGASSEASFSISLNDNDFVRKWIKELHWCLDNCQFVQHEIFPAIVDINGAAEIVSKSCSVINKYLKGYIDIRDNIGKQPQEYLNYLHSMFENLSGEFGKPTRLFSVANPELKAAIRNLNFFVHRIEQYRGEVPQLYISFNKDQYRRCPLEPSDYQYYDFSFPAGTLFVHYAELGKEFVDLYQDGLPLDYSGFKNLHYYSGEAWLNFEDMDMFADTNYVKWLNSNGFDPLDKTLGHGRIPLGTVDNIADAKALIQQHRFLKEVKVEE